VAGRQRAHIKAEKKRAGEFEIRELRIEDGVGEQAVSRLCQEYAKKLWSGG